MFTKRHEQELSEIKALIRDLGERFQQVVEQLARIQDAQDQLAAQGQTATGVGDADSVDAPELDGGTFGARAGAKKARRRTKEQRAGRAGKQAGRAGKRNGGGAPKRLPPAEPAVTSGSDEG
jgi:hypothetical protein